MFPAKSGYAKASKPKRNACGLLGKGHAGISLIYAQRSVEPCAYCVYSDMEPTRCQAPDNAFSSQPCTVDTVRSAHLLALVRLGRRRARCQRRPRLGFTLSQQFWQSWLCSARALPVTPCHCKQAATRCGRVARPYRIASKGSGCYWVGSGKEAQATLVHAVLGVALCFFAAVTLDRHETVTVRHQPVPVYTPKFGYTCACRF